MTGEALTNNTGVELGALLDETVSFIRRYVGLTAEQADTVALWVAHSWTITEFRNTPYLFVTAPDLACGKTRLGEEVVGMLVRDPFKAATATPAALIRKLEDEQTVLIYDEIDGLFKGKGEDPAALELRTLFNAGYQRGQAAWKCVGPQHEPREFPVFGPKVLIGIGDTLPAATMSRCIRVRMERLSPGETVEDWDDEEVGAEAQPIVDQFEAWAEWIRQAERLRVRLDRSIFPVRNRERDLWRPLFTIAHEAGGEWPERVHAACIALTGHGVERSYNARVLIAAYEAFGEDEELSSNDLLVRMAAIDETGPWASWVEDRDGVTRATRSGLTRLGNALRNFGNAGEQLRSQNLTIDGNRVKGFRHSDIEIHARKYAEVVQVVQTGMVAPKQAELRSCDQGPLYDLESDDFPPNHAGSYDLYDLERETGADEAEIERLRVIAEAGK